jgi:tetratricopeptide (TPR) repeat protein
VLTPTREGPVNFTSAAARPLDPEAATILSPAPSGANGDDTTGLPPSAGGVRHVKQPTPERGPLEEGQKFGPRYHIIKLLGIGGMGAVYQAWDAELSVAVALKVVRPEISQDPVAAREIERRFKQELLLARQVTHKNVVRIFDLGEIDGIKYITMSYIQGTDLATTLRQSGRVPVSAVMPLARQIVEGLKAAHEAGVVHRDLKPANIMIEGDHAIVMDFGIARSTSQAGSVPAAISAAGREVANAVLDDAMTRAAATVAGAVVGTVEYMAPEQARGQPVDHRADIYAFGLILYDLLVGRRRAEHAPSAVAELRTRMEQAPPPARSLVAEIPEALDQLVSRCIEPDPASRFQTTDELAAALGRLDDQGEPLPIQRVFGMRVAVAALSFFLVLLVGTWWLSRGPALPVQHDPVSVLIADFQNATGDPTFDRTLEPMLKRALEGAGFISAYDRASIARILGIRPPERLDEVAARELAVKQGLGVVLSGSIDRQANAYRISAKAMQTVTGNPIATAQRRASSKDEVLEVATNLMATIRNALGDDTSESAQMFAMASLSATSLDVVRHYAAAQDAASNNRFEEARQSALDAVKLDPKFGIGYQLLAVASRNSGRLQEAEKYINEALRYLDGMTERERYSTRGMFYRVTGDYEQCVKEYGELIARYAADVVAHNQRALCLSQLRDMRGAVDEMQQVVNLLPNRVLFRDNLALYANYAGDFARGEKEAGVIKEPDVYASLALAFAQLGQGQLPQAIETYQKLGTINALGASFAWSGLGDLATLEGRYSDAVRILEEGAAADLKAMDADRAATKFAALANVQLLRQQNRAAIAAADKALTNSNAVKIRFLTARVFVEAGAAVKAKALSAALASELQAEPRAYAKIIDAEAALEAGEARQAITLLNEANMLLDTWIGHFDLGRAYLEAGAFAQADSEFDRCLKRRGEALALFLDEEPTYGYLPPVYYYQGRVREGLKSTGFVESYRAYLNIRGKSTEDPFLAEVRRRAAG